MLTNTHEDKQYLSILADGKFHMAVEEGTENAKKREYETSDGKPGVKWELLFTELTGIITKIEFAEGEYGTNFLLTVEDDGEKPVVLSLPTASNYAEDMMKKIFSIDMKQPIKLVPYSFTDDKGKNKRGITVYQNEEKVKNYFYDEETKKNLHGYPNTPKPKGKAKTLTKEEWKMYFMNVRLFLIDKIKEHFKIEEEESELEKF